MNISANQVNLNKIIDDLCALNKKCNDFKSESVFPSDDARTIIFTLFSMEIQYLLLSVTLSKRLKDVNFYKDNGYKTDKIDEVFLENSIYQYLSSLSNSYFILIFVQLENYLRLIASNKNIDCFTISKTIKNLDNHYGISQDNKSLMQILLNIRNSMHDGGFFNHEVHKITYRGREFNFSKGKPISFGGIPNNIYLTSEILENLITELNKKTREVEFIEHNYSNLKFEL